MGKTIEFFVGNVKTTAYVAMPSGPGPHPGAVVTFHRGGMDNITEWQVDHVAIAGIAAIAVNHYHALPPGADIEERLKYLTDEQLTNDLQAGANWLASQDNVDGTRLAILGSCMGGRTTLVGLETLPDLWKCGCIWYGGNSFKPLIGNLPAPASIERLRLIRCPISGFYGNEDTNPSPADVDKLDQLLTELGKEHHFYRYDAPHGFQNRFGVARYRQGPAEDSWAKGMTFLGQHLAANARTH